MASYTDTETDIDRPLALIVDADNASARQIRAILAETSKYGTVIIRRVYGDWTSPHMSSWKTVLQDFALVPIQQFTNVSGKNATDSALIIDAMDILHGGQVKGFCIVSSDSDYTRLATRIREAGMFVMAIGRDQTPDAFRRACHIFVATENLVPEPVPAANQPPGPGRTGKSGHGKKPSGSPRGTARHPPADALAIIQQAFDNLDHGDGVVHLAALADTLYRLDPGFDSRSYGKAKLVDLIQSFPDRFAIDRQAKRGVGAVYVRRVGSAT